MNGREGRMCVAAVRLSLLLAVFVCATALPNPVLSQARLAVSVKHVWGGGLIPGRSVGPYTLDSQIRQAFKEMNDLLEEERAPWRLHLEEVVDVKDIPQHFKIQGDEFAQMEQAAVASAGQANDKFAWRTDAINVYVVSEIVSENGQRAAGKCSFPGGSEHSEIIAIANTLEGTLSATWLHEVGHHEDRLPLPPQGLFPVAATATAAEA
jgi:hypothetical protein